MKRLLLFAILSVALNSFAQDTSYSRIYEPLIGELDYNYPVSDAAIVWDDGLITSGVMNTSLNPTYLARISPNGNLMWQKAFGDNSIPDPTISFNQLVSTSDSSFIGVGVYTDAAATENRPFCMKVSATGDTLWTRSFELTGQSGGSFQSTIKDNGKVLETFDSTLLVGFHHTSFAQSPGSPDHFCLTSMDLNGTVLWSKSFITDSSFYLKEMIQTMDSSIYVVGASSDDSQYGVLLKLNSDGQLDWSRKYVGVYFGDIEADSNHLYVSWWSEVSFQFERGMLKLDLNGNFVKRVSFNSGLTDYDGISTVQRSNGNLVTTSVDLYFAFGHGFYEITDNLDYVSAYEAWMVMNELVSIRNKGIYAIGFGPTYGVKAGNVEMGVVRMDSTMNISSNDYVCAYSVGGDVIIEDSLLWGIGVFADSDPLSFYQPDLIYTDVDFISDEGCVTFLGSVDEIQGSWNETVSPNPSSGEFTISWGEYRNAEVVIHNSMGQEVLRSSANHSFIEFDLQAEQNGIYYYILIDENGSQSNGKLVLMR